MSPPALSEITRRALLGGLAGAGLAMPGFSRLRSAFPLVNDVTGMNPVPVARLVRPRNSGEVSRLLGDWQGPVSIGGGCFSMGGQVAEQASLHLDMRGMNRLLSFQPAAKTVRVQTRS